jgi:hypothetical protein
LLYASYVEYGVSDRLHYLPFVHLDGFVSERSDRARVDEDFDFMFTGVLTERRRRLLEDLGRLRYAVTYLPERTPAYMRHHFMRRAKVYRYLNWYTTLDDLIAAASLDPAQRDAQVAEQRERFRASRTGNPFAEILAPSLDGSGTPAARAGLATRR